MSIQRGEFNNPETIRGVGKALTQDLFSKPEKLFFVRPLLDACLRNLARRIVRGLHLTCGKINLLAYRESQMAASFCGALEDCGAVVLPEWPLYRKGRTDASGHLDYLLRVPRARIDEKFAMLVALELKMGFHDPNSPSKFGKVLTRKWDSCVRQITTVTKSNLGKAKHEKHDVRLKIALQLISLRTPSQKPYCGTRDQLIANMVETGMALGRVKPNWVGAVAFHPERVKETANPYNDSVGKLYPGFVLVAKIKKYSNR